jgi:ribonuclease R
MVAPLVIPQAVAIDAATTRDRDDALWVATAGDGFHITVAVANVADSVPAGSVADRRAQARGASAYHSGGRVAPMLPAALESRLTLGAAADQAVLAITAHLAPDGTVTGTVQEGVLATTQLVSYSAVDALLTPPAAANADAALAAMLQAAAQVAPRLLARRQARGALAVFDTATGWASNEDGTLVRLTAAQRHIGHLIVQECMILANEILAGWAAERDLPILYRNHHARALAPPRAQLLADLTAAAAHPEAFNPATLARTTGLILEPASYAPYVSGHYGLNLAAYTHATSPLRRYADLATQRGVLAHLRGQPVSAAPDLAALGAALTAQERERRTATAAHLKTQAQAASYALGAQTALDTLDADRFHKVLKVRLAAGALLPALAAEAGRRFDQDATGPRDAYVVLFGAAPEPLRAAAGAWTARTPSPALSVLGLLSQQEQLPAVAFTEQRAGPDHARRFTAQAQLARAGTLYRSAVRTAGSKQAARAQAALSLLCALAGLPDGSTDASPPGPDPPPAAPVWSPPAPSTDPVSALYAWTQQHRLPAPVFTFHPAGPAHLPTFTAVCTVTGADAQWTGQGSGASKALAKAAAAHAVILHLQTVASLAPAALPPRR